MKEHTDVTACVIDRGTFWGVAERLARDYKKVYYHRPSGEDCETFAECSKGDGHPNVDYLGDFWPRKNEIDLFIFPDCTDAGLQEELKSQGKAVWGSMHASHLEKMRGQWQKLCKQMGMPFPQTIAIAGLRELERYLMEHEGVFYVKISKYRGDMETWKADSSEPMDTQNYLDYLALKFGPFADSIRFYVQKEIETDIEIGTDTYFCAGQFPRKLVLGYEKKAKAYLSYWLEREAVPDKVWQPTEIIQPVLAELGYCNFISSEVRITAEGESFWLDPCFRFPSPAGEDKLELYANLPEIIWHGANGELVEPKMAARYSGAAGIAFTGQKDAWKSVKVPEEVRKSVKLYASAYTDGYNHFPPATDPGCIGWAIALGDSPQEVLDGLKEIAKALADAPVELGIVELADLFPQIESAKEQGIPFGSKPLPAPADVIET